MKTINHILTNESNTGVESFTFLAKREVPFEPLVKTDRVTNVVMKKNPQNKLRGTFFDSDIIVEAQTTFTTSLFMASIFSGKITANCEIGNLIKTDDNPTVFEENNNIKSIANNLLSKIEELESKGKKFESIKGAHKLFEDILSMPSVELAEQILKQTSTRNFSLGILIAFLASTLPFKEELTNRSLVFEKAQEVALSELGQEKLNKSIFNNLK